MAAGRAWPRTPHGGSGLGAQAIEDWYAEATGPRCGTSPDPKTGWLSTRVGYLQQATYSPPFDTPPSDHTTVHYLLTWPAAP